MVLALDVFDPLPKRIDHATRVLENTKRHVAAVKMNHHLLLPFGLEGVRDIISMCKEERLPMIADLKINDIESTNMNIVESLFGYGLDAVIANPLVGYEEGLGRVIGRIHELSGGILFLVYMSHRGAREGYSLATVAGEPLYRAFAKRAKTWGADGVVVSANSREKIRETRKIVGRKCLIFSPGVGVQGGEAASAVSAGADFLIVGRTITEAPDPSKALQRLNAMSG